MKSLISYCDEIAAQWVAVDVMWQSWKWVIERAHVEYFDCNAKISTKQLANELTGINAFTENLYMYILSYNIVR